MEGAAGEQAENNQTDESKFSSNIALLNWNLYIYIATIFPFLFTFLVAYFTSKDPKAAPDSSTQACTDYILVDTSHFTVQLSNIPRAIISCYMNI